MSREMRKGDLVLMLVVVPAQQGKLQPNYKGSYLIFHKLPHKAYKLQELDGQLLPRTWNVVHLKYYYT